MIRNKSHPSPVPVNRSPEGTGGLWRIRFVEHIGFKTWVENWGITSEYHWGITSEYHRLHIFILIWQPVGWITVQQHKHNRHATADIYIYKIKMMKVRSKMSTLRIIASRTDFTDLNLYCIKGALALVVLVSFSGYVC